MDSNDIVALAYHTPSINFLVYDVLYVLSLCLSELLRHGRCAESTRPPGPRRFDATRLTALGGSLAFRPCLPTYSPPFITALLPLYLLSFRFPRDTSLSMASAKIATLVIRVSCPCRSHRQAGAQTQQDTSETNQQPDQDASQAVSLPV